MKINKNMIDYLNKGITKNVSGSEKGLGIDELVKTMNYYKTKSEELEIVQVKLTNEKKGLSTSVTRFRAQRDQESIKSGKISGILKLTLNAPRTASTSFTITYYTASASWSPYFDISIASVDKPIIIAVKSKVRQTTGFD